MNKLNEEINRVRDIMKNKNIISEQVISDNDFNKFASIVIDKLEGGYYHPDMLKDGRVKSSLYNSSGETMFGIDRLRGGTINSTQAGREFWSIIDSLNARKNWKWNYKGGEYGNRLKMLVSLMMKPQYDSYCKLYLTPKSQSIINSNSSLLFNFIYATWNGPGWFKYFANRFNTDVNNGITNVNTLIDKVIQYRKESGDQIIINTGKRMEQFIKGVSNIKADSALSSTTDLNSSSSNFNAADLNAMSDFKAADLNAV